MTYYELLGVAYKSTPAEVNAARRAAALKHHPDRGGSHAKMAEINVAYDTLSDGLKHRGYRADLFSAGYRQECDACDGTGLRAKQQGFAKRTKSICAACHGVGRLFTGRRK